jgi:hypothetical protein
VVLFAQLSFGISDIAYMTLPRQVVPACDYMITRRCSERPHWKEASNAAYPDPRAKHIGKAPSFDAQLRFEKDHCAMR